MMEMFAIGYKYQEDVFVDFMAEADELGLKHSSLLPTRKMAEEYIEEVLCDDYGVVPITITVVRNEFWSFDYEGLTEWEENFR